MSNNSSICCKKIKFNVIRRFQGAIYRCLSNSVQFSKTSENPIKLVDTVNWDEIFSHNVQKKPVIIDARSPSEYNYDHIANAVNVPVLDDDSYKRIGLLYSKVNENMAKILGAGNVCTNIGKLLENQSSLLYKICNESLTDLDNCPNVVIYCARGGKRSRSLAKVLSELGLPHVFAIENGYKTYRRKVLSTLNSFPMNELINVPFAVLSGLTGSGKTIILQHLSRTEPLVLDLENLADHKGSMLGAPLKKQNPINQRQFETRLFEYFSDISKIINKSKIDSDVMWVECESRFIGPHCQLSNGLWSRIAGMKVNDASVLPLRIWLEVDRAVRVKHILEDYKYFLCEDHAFLEELVKKFQKYQSKKCIESWICLLKSERYEELVDNVLEVHYDPIYKSSRKAILNQSVAHNRLVIVNVPALDSTTVSTVVIPQLLDLREEIRNKWQEALQ